MRYPEFGSRVMAVVLGVILGRDTLDSWLLNKVVPTCSTTLPDEKGYIECKVGWLTLSLGESDSIFFRTERHSQSLDVISTVSTGDHVKAK